MPRYKVRFMPLHIELEVESGNSLLDLAYQIGIPLGALCTGNGACGKCRVQVFPADQRPPVPSKTESWHLTEKEIREGIRLACQVKIDRDLDVYLLGSTSIQQEVTAYKRRLPALPALPYPVDFTGGQRDDYGLAMDVGSTSIGGYLCGPGQPSVVGSASRSNPQLVYGEDIVSRLTYVQQHARGFADLQKALFDGMNRMIVDLCRQNGISPQKIRRVSVVGNSFIHYCLLGHSPDSLMQSPYEPAFKAGFHGPVSRWNPAALPALPGETALRIFPLVGGFVGGDLVAAVLASDMHRQEKMTLLIDLGTNSEVALGNRQGIVVASASAGPSFEGGQLFCGSRAQAGAIERIIPDGEGLSSKGSAADIGAWPSALPGYQLVTVDHAYPKTLCGSGAISLLALMMREGHVDSLGHLHTVNDRIGNRPAFLIFKGNRVIGLTQQDINALQKAKAAIFAAVVILARERGISMADIERVLVTGAFGTQLPVEEAKQIGLLPNLPGHCIDPMDNAAGIGAITTLFSRSAWQEAERLSTFIRHVRLGGHADFNQEFIKAMFLPHEDDALFRTGI